MKKEKIKIKKENNSNYLENAKELKNLKPRYILIQSWTGFGNKIFDLIIAVYLKNYLNYYIYFADIFSIHSKKLDPLLVNIFPNLSSEILFISENESDYIRYKIKNTKIPNKRIIFNDNIKLKDFNQYFTTDRILLKTSFLYSYVFEIWKIFNNKEKLLFNININLINNSIIDISKTKYAAIHIRYGDKLKYALEYKNKFSFPLFTPQYYFDQITLLLKKNYTIVILTDSIKLIKYFLIEKYKINNDNLFLLDTNFLDSFYLLMYSSCLIMSHSTFSYSASLLGDFKEKEIILCSSKKYEQDHFTLDYMVSKDWLLIDNKKYFLNYDDILLKKMEKFIEKKS